LSGDALPPDSERADEEWPHFSIASHGRDAAFDAVRRWRPDVCFSHDVEKADVDRQLLDVAPVVKFVHAYEATCVSGRKMFSLPGAQPCDRAFGVACTALFFPRRCGGRSVTTMLRQYRMASARHALLERYRAIVVASSHMKRECVRNGAEEFRVHVNPLFPAATRPTEIEPADRSVVFVGRMTALKGASVLIRAVAEASVRLGRPIHVTMVGDGPERARCERLAAQLGVSCTFAGWQDGDERWPWLQRATLLAVPSQWPEPFGLVGLEAASLGVPAIAFDVGGIREWLVHGKNGYLVPADPPTAAAFAEGLVAAFNRPEELRAMRHNACASAREMSLARHLDRLEHTLVACP
jgi:glycosyltransferase involved in cell wall biosynthesis